MLRLRLLTLLSLALLLSLAPALPAECPPFTARHNTYYSDFFVTAVGSESFWCDETYSTWGTLAGPYLEFTWERCCEGFPQSGRRCYVDNNGTWMLINCP